MHIKNSTFAFRKAKIKLVISINRLLLGLLTISWSMICSRNGRTTTIRTKSWPFNMI